jgi:hypothetical protein
LYATAEVPELKDSTPEGPVIMGHNIGMADPANAYLLGIVHGVCIAATLVLLVVAIRHAFRPRRQRIQLDSLNEHA